MMEPLDMFMVFLYVFLDLIPCLALVLVPHRAHFRFSPFHTYGVIPVLFIMVFICRILALEGVDIAGIFTILWMGFYLVLLRIYIKTPVCILLFTLLTVLNYGSFKAVMVNGIACLLPAHFVGRYSFCSSLVQLLVYAVTYPFMYGMMVRKVRPLAEQTRENVYWRFLWLVPAAFCFSYYFSLYSNGGTVVFASNGSNVLFVLILNFSALFITFLILQLLKECNDKLLLEQENHHLAMQSVQYESLRQRIEEVRHARHDLRQHLSVVQTFLQEEDYESLSKYIHEYSTTIPLDAPIIYCEDYALNAVIVYYESMAKERGICFSADIDYPIDSRICSSDGVILFGNLLENAIEACSREKGESFITLKVQQMHQMIVVTMDNTCTVVQPYKYYDYHHGREGIASSKGPRMGMGIVSIQRIAEKYHGMVNLKQENGIFYSSVLLNP